MTVGQRLKDLRQRRNMTLQQLADATELSIGYLSNLEHDRTSPTIAALFKLCSVLQEDISTFLQAFDSKKRIIRKDEREAVYFKPSKTTYESISDTQARLKGYCITIGPGGVTGGSHDSRSQSHNNDEIGLIQKGSMEIRIGDETYLLEEGDSFYIEANTPHRYKNNGKEECVLICVIS